MTPPDTRPTHDDPESEVGRVEDRGDVLDRALAAAKRSQQHVDQLEREVDGDWTWNELQEWAEAWRDRAETAERQLHEARTQLERAKERTRNTHKAWVQKVEYAEAQLERCQEALAELQRDRDWWKGIATAAMASAEAAADLLDMMAKGNQ